MKIITHAKSDTGNVRDCNEDYCEICEEHQFAVICDGMGGHRAGAVASELAASTFKSCFISDQTELHSLITPELEKSIHDFASSSVSSVRLANQRVFQLANSDSQMNGMGTTFSGIVFRENTACLCHVGDSRIYRLRGNNLTLLTEDHTWVNELIKDNEINEDDPFYAEKRHVLTRALGISPATKIDLIIDPVRKNDIYMLCTDGLTIALADDMIKEIMLAGSDDLKNTADTLVETAKRIDGSDNISVILAKIVRRDKNKSKFGKLKITLAREKDKTLALERKFLHRHFGEKEAKSNMLFGVFVATLLALLCIFLWDHFSLQKVVNQWALFNKFSQNGQLAAEDSSHRPFENKIIAARDTLRKLDLQDLTQSEQYQSISLSESVGDSGFVFLIGLEKFLLDSGFHINVNGKNIGPARAYLHRGIKIPPGENDIKGVNGEGDILFDLPNVTVSRGSVKAIEIVPMKRQLR